MTLASTDPAVIVALLDAFGDQIPAPRPPKWEAEGERGLSAASWHTCGTCHGDQTIKRRKHRATCPTCRGAGRWRTDAYDDKDLAVQPDSKGASELTLSEFYDIAEKVGRDDGMPGIERLERYIERRLDTDLGSKARDAHPCWQTLADSLDELYTNEPFQHFIVCHTLILHTLEPHALILPYRQLLVRGVLNLGEILRRMDFHAPLYIRRRAERDLPHKPNGNGRHALNPAQRAKRDAEIKRLAEKGWHPPAIGKRMNLDRRTVERILDKNQEAA